MSSTINDSGGDHLIRFEIRDGARRITCQVSNEALEAASGLAEGSSTILRRRSFDRFRTLIHAAAALRVNALLPNSANSILLTTQDLRRAPSEQGKPPFGVAARTSLSRILKS